MNEVKLHIKDLGQLHYSLGIEVVRDQKRNYLSQKKYVLDMLQETGRMHAKPVDSLLEVGVKLQPD